MNELHFSDRGTMKPDNGSVHEPMPNILRVKTPALSVKPFVSCHEPWYHYGRNRKKGEHGSQIIEGINWSHYTRAPSARKIVISLLSH